MSNPLAATRTWLESVVIAHTLCPFAKRELDLARIRFFVDEASRMTPCLEHLIDECVRLDDDPEIATTLLIYPQAFAEFEDYLDFVALAEDLLEAQGYEGVYQLASFHPDYCFADASQDDPANYTNRSPFPMLHLLREASLDFAVETYPDVEGIPQRNIELTRQLGLKHMQALLAACYQPKA